MYGIPNRCESEFLNFMSNLHKDIGDTPVIIGTDQNIDLLKISNRHVNDLIDILNDTSLVPNIMIPTRVTKSSATLIDQVYATSSLCRKVYSNVIITDISDHFPCLTTFGVKINRVKDICFEGRNLCDANINMLCDYMKCYDWSNLGMFDVEQATELAV